ncbi:MAG: PCMD domain-containing protein [Alloprevotella sp.]|nr:PCMD domain-containing protein [Alloprevotella sp.]
MTKYSFILPALFAAQTCLAENFPADYDIAAPEQGHIEYVKFGNFDQWITRNIKESGIIGGKTKTIYAIGPTATWNENKPYLGAGGSPWATSNVMAHVKGIYKTNLSVYREARPGHGYCAKLYTHLEECKVLGLINIKVLAAGSIFLGQMMEPITSASDPMKKLNCGQKFTKKPKAICFDYKVQLSGQPARIKQTGFGGASKVAGMDMPDCIVFLQKRWEDAKGNIFAKRVGTMVQRFPKNTGWVNNAQFAIHYGDITGKSFYQSYMGLTKGSNVRYAKNSKGKMVPIQEVGWADADETPTHLIIQFDSSHGGAYIGSVGNTFWVDNVRLVY